MKKPKTFKATVVYTVSTHGQIDSTAEHELFVWTRDMVPEFERDGEAKVISIKVKEVK